MGSGCILDNDCCGDQTVCSDGYCFENHFEINNNNPLAVNKNNQIFGLSPSAQIAALIAIILCIVCSSIYCFLKIRKKNNNDRDDDEYYYENEQIMVRGQESSSAMDAMYNNQSDSGNKYDSEEEPVENVCYI